MEQRIFPHCHNYIALATLSGTSAPHRVDALPPIFFMTPLSEELVLTSPRIRRLTIFLSSFHHSHPVLTPGPVTTAVSRTSLTPSFFVTFFVGSLHLHPTSFHHRHRLPPTSTFAPKLTAHMHDNNLPTSALHIGVGTRLPQLFPTLSFHIRGT